MNCYRSVYLKNIGMCLFKSHSYHFEVFQFLSSDTEIPVISGIPPIQNVNTDDSSPIATVSWTQPTANDNSGEAVTLTSSYSPGDTFPIGTTTVTYIGTDTSGNMATSTFNVVVTGKYDNQDGWGVF